MMHISKVLPFIAVVAFCTAIANAHPGHDTSSAASGFAHPLTGWDHLLAMIAVGIWSAQLGGRATYFVPAAFLTAMCLGDGMAAVGLKIHVAEQGILASVLILGLLIALAARLPLAVAALLVAAFAICHGYAHVSELRPSGSLAPYAIGFLISTAFLHVAGLFLGSFLQKARHPVLTRTCGACVVLAGIALWNFSH